MRGMGGLVVCRGYLEREFSDQGFYQELGNLDIRDQRNRKIDSETTSAVPLAGVCGRAAVMVLGRKVDVHVDHVIRQMLG